MLQIHSSQPDLVDVRFHLTSHALSDEEKVHIELNEAVFDPAYATLVLITYAKISQCRSMPTFIHFIPVLYV